MLGSDITIYADRGATWTAQLEALGAEIRPIPAGRWTRGPIPSSQTAIIHNLGGGRFPNLDPVARRPRLIYSVYDWGPFRDWSMPTKARIAWAGSMILGCREADVIHYLNPSLENATPWPVRKRPDSIAAYCNSSMAFVPESWVLPSPADVPYALFVGTAVARKRIQSIVEMSRAENVNVVLVGQGTEVFNLCPNVDARGRIPDSELNDLLNKCAALILVSRYEGFGIPVLEAATRGIQSVVSKEVFATLPLEMRSHVEVTDPNDSTNFASAVAIASAKRGSKKFSPSTLMDELIAEYTDALGQ